MRIVMRTREEHVQFCKEQAMMQYEFDMSGEEYADPGRAIINACTTMLCDLAKHEECKAQSEACTMLVFTVTDYNSMIRFINGFN